ncbi:MAG: FtsH protease activity modulator HflK [Oceanococcus sp.]
MAWNEPGPGGGKDPWDSNNGGPPDLDELLKKFRGRFGGNKGGSSGGGKASGGIPKGLITVAALIAGGLWLLSGFYIVQPAERGVVLQFGRYLSTVGEGPHWHAPWPVQTVEKVNVDGIRNISDQQTMLTQDENIVVVDMAVQYRVSSAEDFVFRVRDPDLTLRHALKSSVREVVGKSTMDFILTAGREEVAQRTELLLQETLDSYRTGLVVNEVNIKDAQPPEPVQGAFADAIKAREDEQRLINESEAYANSIVPQARGEAVRMVTQANAYKTRVIEQSTGEASRFTQLLDEYQKAPEVTRQRLYLETMDYVLSNTNKVIMDVEQSNPLLYLPMDKLASERRVNAPSQHSSSPTGGLLGSSPEPIRSGGSSTARDGRSASRERGRR